MKRFIIIISILTGVFGHLQMQAQTTLLSGIKRGSYHTLAHDIEQVSDSIEILSSHGSLENYNQLIAAQEPLISFMQFDVLVDQQMRDIDNGTDITKDVKLLLPLGYEEIHLLTREYSNIKTLEDLKGKRVVVGAPTQGTYVTAQMIKKITKIDWDDVQLSFDVGYNALMNKEVDALFFVGYAPAKSLYRLIPSTKLRLVPIENKALKKVYTEATIPGGTYKWSRKPVKTFAVKSVLVTKTFGNDPQHEYNIRKMLTDIKNSIAYLQESKHRNWKKVNFDFSNIDWAVHRVAEDIFGLSVDKEKKSWQKAMAVNSIVTYENFKRAFPNSEYVALANQKIDELYKLRRAKSSQTTNNTVTYKKSYTITEADKKAIEDENLWKLATLRNTIASYEEYLMNAPDGKFVELAKLKLQAMVESYTEREQKAWKTAVAKNTVKSFNDYLLDFPAGKNKGLAEQRRIELIKEQTAWEIVSKINNVNGYREFMNTYNSSTYSRKAQMYVKNMIINRILIGLAVGLVILLVFMTTHYFYSNPEILYRFFKKSGLPGEMSHSS